MLKLDIVRYSHFTQIIVFDTFLGSVMDTANYSFHCKLRGPEAEIPGGVITLDTTKESATSIRISLTKDKTQTLNVAKADNNKPTLDIRVRPVNEQDVYTEQISVNILDSISHD